MTIKSLSAIRRREEEEIEFGKLPQAVSVSSYAMAKAFKICELVRIAYGSHFEWYGFTIADKNDPEFIVDIGLPKNDHNFHYRTGIEPERIAGFQELLSSDRIINGWIHSHADLEFRRFSRVDESNHITVLHYVTASLRKPIAKREVRIGDLSLLTANQYGAKDLERGSVSLITDRPIGEATIMEAVYGGFSYGIVIGVGDESWHEQVIHTIRRGILSGKAKIERILAELFVRDTERSLSEADIEMLFEEVREKIRPMASAGLRSAAGSARPVL